MKVNFFGQMKPTPLKYMVINRWQPQNNQYELIQSDMKISIAGLLWRELLFRRLVKSRWIFRMCLGSLTHFLSNQFLRLIFSQVLSNLICIRWSTKIYSPFMMMVLPRKKKSGHKIPFYSNVSVRHILEGFSSKFVLSFYFYKVRKHSLISICELNINLNDLCRQLKLFRKR